MRTVKVKKDELYEIMKTNREAHWGVFMKAQEAYKAYLIKELEQRLDEAQKGMKIDHYIRLEAPVNHTEDYDRACAMVKMSVEDIIELSEQDFAQYVMDQWAWKHAFVENAGSYGVETPPTPRRLQG